MAVTVVVDEYLLGKSGIVRKILAAALVADVEDRGDRVRYWDAVYAQVPGFRPLPLDLEVPVARSPVAVVVYLHGGGFTGGTHRTGRDGLGERVREELVGRGIAVAAVGYRLSGEALFPAQVRDVKAAERATPIPGRRLRRSSSAPRSRRFRSWPRSPVPSRTSRLGLLPYCWCTVIGIAGFRSRRVRSWRPLTGGRERRSSGAWSPGAATGSPVSTSVRCCGRAPTSSAGILRVPADRLSQVRHL